MNIIKTMFNVLNFQIDILILFTVVQCEVYTAITEVENLLHTHDNVLRNLKQYIQVEESRLNVLKKYLRKITDDHEKAVKDVKKYVENPINAFTLVKRLSTDFQWLKIVASNPAKFVWDQTLVYPTEEDLIGAAVAIGRLQLLYKLNTTHLAEGNLKGAFGYDVSTEMFSPMTASDCYNLALMMYKEGTYNYHSYATEWYETALEKLHILLTDNNHLFIDSKFMEYAPVDIHTRNRYGELCRGEVNIFSANASKLHCSYLKMHPFLRLAPIKMEELHKKPDIFLFHDVVSDSEIEIMKEIASPKLERAYIMDGGEKIASEVRVGKSAWLDDYNDTIERVKRRTADFTGLSTSDAEPFQVLNYGIGGHYDVHYDDPVVYNGVGQRIATVLFYMSDVAQGGATVFPILHLTVRPKKGTALYWMNLHPSGEVDRKTLHGACPVLYGYKWVANMWIHGAGQELLQPCPLTID